MSLEQAREAIAEASYVAFFTGAGMSTESGIPTFRGSGGLWEGFRPEELATPGAFASSPRRVWDWYCWRRQKVAEAVPHAGHLAVADYLERHPGGVVTQNVDGLHQRSGCPEVIELHGSLWRRRCQVCDLEEPDDSTEYPELPVCSSCGGSFRPGVVWFGESLPPGPWGQAPKLLQRADVIIVVGTSAVVEPAASLVGWSRSEATTVIEVNPDPAHGGAVLQIAQGAGEALPRLLL